MIEISARPMTTGVAHWLASGNSCRQNRIMPYVPTLSSTPTSSTAVAGLDCSAASGSQVCTGHIGALTAKAMKKPRKSRFWVRPGICRPVRLSTRKPVLPRGPWKYRPMTATSMIRPPASENSRNFIAAALRRGPPYEPMRK